MVEITKFNIKNGAIIDIDDLEYYIISNEMKQVLNKYNK